MGILGYIQKYIKAGLALIEWAEVHLPLNVEQKQKLEQAKAVIQQVVVLLEKL